MLGSFVVIAFPFVLLEFFRPKKSKTIQRKISGGNYGIPRIDHLKIKDPRFLRDFFGIFDKSPPE